MRRLLLTWLLLAAPAALVAQQAAPPRDTSAAATKGTAVIKGRVVAADTGKPLRRARVAAAGIGLGRDGQKATSTGLDGTFVLKELPAGRYRITVNRGGYLRIDYGQSRPNEQGRPVEVAEGQTVEGIDIALPRMSGIAGRVTDETGDAIEGVEVFAMRSLFFEGRRKLVPVSGTSVRTDDEGAYRIPRLAPGAYQVMASTKETWTILDSSGRETVFGYMPTYFPGVAAPTQALRVTVGLGEWAQAIDFALVPGRAAKVSGLALDSKGRPFSRVSLSEHVRGLNFASFRGGYSATVAADGSFTIRDVPPGEYSLEASRYGPGTEGPPEAAVMTVFVDGTDLENLTLVGSNGGIVSGRVVSESGVLPKTSDIFITIQPSYRMQQPPVLLGAFREGRSGPTVQEDGNFKVENVFGAARFNVRLPEGWMVKSIEHEGRDVADAVFELKSQEQVSGVEILITDRVTEANGLVIDDKNAPVGQATVLLFPVEAERWYENARAVRATRPDQQGRWQIKALPAGEYLGIALDYMEVDAWHDPEYLESLRRYATRITIPDDGTQSATLKLVVPEK